MKLQFIKNFLNKIVAKQLRRPNGFLAGRVGREMNKTNSFLYDFTIKEMRVADHDEILEIGFGNGMFFGKIFSAANNVTLSGLDFSPEMVKAAAANNPLTSNNGKLTLRLGSSDKIPFPDNSFDKVFCINVIYFWEEPAVHLQEICRVLKPGGRLYTSIRMAESLVKMPFTKYGFTVYRQDEWVGLLEANGFHFERATKTINEPDAEFNQESIKVESLCIVAEKTMLT